MEDDNFKELYFKLVDLYKIPPDIAKEMLQKILEILAVNEQGQDFEISSEWNFQNL